MSRPDRPDVENMPGDARKTPDRPKPARGGVVHRASDRRKPSLSIIYENAAERTPSRNEWVGLSQRETEMLSPGVRRSNVRLPVRGGKAGPLGTGGAGGTALRGEP